jgi:16S rRNA (guanine527-N7)-methyltransferase
VVTDFTAAMIACETAAGVHIDAGARSKLETYYSLLRRWNERVSLTSLPLEGFPAATLNRLLIEPAVAAALIPDETLAILDVGSGGGSPGVPLKILRPQAEFTLTESRQKKIAFLREAVRVIGLPGIQVLDGRVEDHHWRGRFDWISLRAVRLDRTLATVLLTALRPSGRLLMFGAELPPGLGFRLEDRRTLPGGSPLTLLAPAP